MELFQSNPVMHADLLKSADFTLQLASQGREIKLFEHSLHPLYPIVEELSRITANPHSANPFIYEHEAVTGAAAQRVKEAWVLEQLRKKEPQFAEFTESTIFVGTWNVNGYGPAEDLSGWINIGEAAEIYVFGFQELDMSTEAYLISDKTKENNWSQAIETFLWKNMDVQYVKVAARQLVGMLLLVYASEKIADLITDVTTEAVGTGLLGMMGNKGAVACRLRYRDSFLCFVNAHLAADPGQVERRNQDQVEIAKRMQFQLPAETPHFTAYHKLNPWVASGADSPNMPGAGARKSHLSIYDCDHMFYFGDLNYRIPLPFETVTEMSSNGLFPQLFELDQLNIEKKAKRAFVDFQEAEVSFPPTFKYDIGTSNFDTSEKKRVPSWCDRIMWFSNPIKRQESDWLVASKYSCCMGLSISDHKPVMSLFRAKIRTLDKTKMASVSEEAQRALDKMENEANPSIKVELNEIDFGEVSFLTPVIRAFVVENVGHVGPALHNTVF
ncbi:hypothetical protein HK405_011401 [Cladochytrium tenue]|nr:hypothetical protein HK405_011401 [Cladochytrium tenue]